MESNRGRRRLWMVRGFAAALICILLIIAVGYAYEMPGGIADWRYSRAAGIEGTLKIPIGRTPEEAVRKFRQSSMRVIHREAIPGGNLLFLKRNGDQEKESTNLQLEFTRKGWLGWKWVMGGGYGISSRPDAGEALNYMGMPSMTGIDGPFPILFGQLSSPDIASVQVSAAGVEAGKYKAKVIDADGGYRLWYVVLPSTAVAPYKLEASNDAEKIVARQTIDDPRDVRVVRMSP